MYSVAFGRFVTLWTHPPRLDTCRPAWMAGATGERSDAVFRRLWPFMTGRAGGGPGQGQSNAVHSGPLDFAAPTSSNFEGARPPNLANAENRSMHFHLGVAHLQPIVALAAGVLILVRPRLLNYIVAIYLILSGIMGLGLIR
jgi:Protein of unknown function (DUF3096)